MITFKRIVGASALILMVMCSAFFQTMISQKVRRASLEQHDVTYEVLVNEKIEGALESFKNKPTLTDNIRGKLVLWCDELRDRFGAGVVSDPRTPICPYTSKCSEKLIVMANTPAAATVAGSKDSCTSAVVTEQIAYLSQSPTSTKGRTQIRNMTDLIHVSAIESESLDAVAAGGVESIRQNCKYLDPMLFWVCRHGATDEWVGRHLPCSRWAFVARIRNAFIDNHKIKPGTIFNDTAWFRWQPYIPPPRPRGPRSRKTFLDHDCIATVIQPNPTQPGHFANEVLPKLLYLLETVPAHCKVLVGVTNFTNRFLKEFPPETRQRFMPWLNDFHRAKEVYTVGEGPYCELQLQNPQYEGAPTHFLSSVISKVRSTFVPMVIGHAQFTEQQSAERVPLSLKDLSGNVPIRVLIIKRYPKLVGKRFEGNRSYKQHDALFAALNSTETASKRFIHGTGHPVKVKLFDASGGLPSHVNAFNTADIVIGPHGAGFANLVFCRPGTKVVEIGYNSGANALPPMFYQMSRALKLDYRLLIANGTKSSELDLDHEIVLATLRNWSIFPKATLIG